MNREELIKAVHIKYPCVPMNKLNKLNIRDLEMLLEMKGSIK